MGGSGRSDLKYCLAALPQLTYNGALFTNCGEPATHPSVAAKPFPEEPHIVPSQEPGNPQRPDAPILQRPRLSASLTLLCKAFLVCFALLNAPAVAQQATEAPEPTSEQTSEQPAPQPTPSTPAATGAPGAATGSAAQSEQPNEGEAEPGQASPVDAIPAAIASGFEDDLQTIRGYNVILKQIAAALARDNLSDEELTSLRTRLEPIRNDLPAKITQFQTQLTNVQARVDQLGPAPAEGEPPEAETVALQRSQLEQGLTTVSGALSQSRLLLVEADQHASRIAERRRDRFAATLAERTHSVVSPTLWLNAAPLVLPAFDRLRLLFAESGRATVNRLSAAFASENPTGLGQLLLLLAALAVSVGLLFWGHSYLQREVTGRADALQAEDRLTRLTIAVWSLVFQGFLPLVALAISLFTLSWLDIFPRRFVMLVTGLAVGAGVFFVLRALAFAILRPNVAALRLVAIQDGRAWTLTRIVIALGAIIGIDAALNTAFDVVAAQLDLEVASSGLFATIVAALLFVLIRATAGSSAPEAQATSPTTAETTPVPEPSFSGSFQIWARLALWLALIAIATTALSGYIALSAYIAGQVIYAGAVLATLYLLLKLADEISAAILTPESVTGAKLTRATGLKRSALDQFVVLIGGILRLTLIIVAAILVLVPWGFETREWAAWIRRAFFGFEVGEITISLSAILSALVLFGIGYAITRAIQSWLDNRFLPRTELDVGLKTSIRTGLGYLGIVAAAAFAVSFVGLDLANLAIVAGALSVGIGFGLQSVVNNFVSGLILLAERPIKVGDWIEAGGEQGYVRRINVRSTEVQTFDRASVIIPNSDLISGVVKNMMHGGKLGRIKINVGVSYDSDIDQVRELMQDCAQNHPMVLSYPEPKVFFLDFGASSLDLSLYAFLGDVDNSLSVASELRYAILSRFREAGIEIPFPQRDLNVRGAVRFEPQDGDDVVVSQVAEPEAQPPRKRKTAKASSEKS